VTCAKQLRCARATFSSQTSEHPDRSEGGSPGRAAMQQREGPRREGANGCGTCNVHKAHEVRRGLGEEKRCWVRCARDAAPREVEGRVLPTGPTPREAKWQGSRFDEQAARREEDDATLETVENSLGSCARRSTARAELPVPTATARPTKSARR
jgi:hypothetical protein